ncbi:MAG: DUF3631 domain-containing protein [Desulfobulbus sp.]
MGDHAGTATGKRSKEKKRVARDPEDAATEAGRRWQAAGPANREHPYLAGKGLDGRGLRQEGNLLLVPMCDGEGAVRSLQTISAEGRKLFLKGGAVTGLYCPIGDIRESGKSVCVVEGWATGAAIHAAGGYPVAVAFSAGNLAQVAGIIRAKLPGCRLILCADDDCFLEKANNPGIRTAELIRALCDDDEKAWPTFNRGNPITPRQLANKLKGYGINSTTLRFRHAGLAKGYERKQFEEAFSRYIPSEGGVLSVTA